MVNVRPDEMTIRLSEICAADTFPGNPATFDPWEVM